MLQTKFQSPSINIAEPQTHLYLPHRLVVDITIDSPTTTTTTTTTLSSRAIGI